MTSISNAGAPVRAAKAAERPETNDVPLEPKDELPKVQPYKMTVGGWIGTGVASLLGGAAAAGVLGIIGVASDLGSGGQGGMAGILMGVGALAGFVGTGVAIHAMSQSNYEQREHARIQAEHGTSTLEHARGLMSKFDHNDNGRIDLVNDTGLASQDERIFEESRTQSRTHRKYDWINDEWDRETERWKESRGTSAAGVWTAANVDPKDDVVSDIELARLMSAFDTDRNGALTTAEQDAFKQAHPVIVEAWSR